MSTSKYTLHLDRSRCAVADNEAVARNYINERPEDNSRWGLFEYIGGCPNSRDSYRELEV